MRFNRGTIALFLISVIVIGLILVLSNNRASAPDEEATPTPVGGGSLFGTVDQNAIVRFEVHDNQTGQALVMTKDDQDIWSIQETAFPGSTGVDQVMIVGSMGIFATLPYETSFTSADVENFDLADFGLAEPVNTLSLTNSDGTIYTLSVGKKNPGSTRYYTQVEIVPGTEATPEATAEVTPEVATSAETVYLVKTSDLGNLIRLIVRPPYQATATPTQTPYPTANPYSEVEQTATAAIIQTATAAYTPEVTPEATTEATAEVTPEATPEVTPEATQAP